MHVNLFIQTSSTSAVSFLITVEKNTATLDLNSIEKSNLELIKEFKEIV